MLTKSGFITPYRADTSLLEAIKLRSALCQIYVSSLGQIPVVTGLNTNCAIVQ